MHYPAQHDIQLHVHIYHSANLDFKSHYACADCVSQFCFHNGILTLTAQQKQAWKWSQTFKKNQKNNLGEDPEKCMYDPHIILK